MAAEQERAMRDEDETPGDVEVGGREAVERLLGVPSGAEGEDPAGAEPARPDALSVPWTTEVGFLVLISATFGAITHLLRSGPTWSLLFWPLLYSAAAITLALVPTRRPSQRGPVPGPRG
jgi:hypothetical protein